MTLDKIDNFRNVAKLNLLGERQLNSLIKLSPELLYFWNSEVLALPRRAVVLVVMIKTQEREIVFCVV